MNCNIVHEEGYKDQYKVSIKFDDGDFSWSPTNQHLFKLTEKVFESEEHEFGDGYGSRWLWFYMSLIMLGEEQKAYQAYGLRGINALNHFEKSVDKYADDIIETLEELKQEVK